MADKRTKLRHNREKREQNYATSRERVKEELQARTEDWERKAEQWKVRVNALDKKRTAAVEEVL